MSENFNLADVCTVTMGQAPNGDSYNTVNKGWPLIAGAGDFGEIFPAPTKFTTEAQKLSTEGDIILSIRASIGTKVLSDSEYCLGRGVAGLRPTSKVDPRFLWHWLTENSSLLASKGKGATFKQVNSQDIKELRIPVPPLATQKQIARVLDHVDALRTKRRAAIARLDELAQSLFLDMFGIHSKNSSEWPLVNFSDLVESPLRNGVSPASNGEFQGNVLTLAAITGNSFDPSATKEGRFRDLPTGKYASPDDFLICRGNGNRDLVGKGAFARKIEPNTVFPDTMISARPSLSKITNRYLEFAWRSSHTRHQIDSAARTTNGTYKVNQSALNSIKIPLPPLAIQESFAEVVDAACRSAATHQTHLAKLDELFASLQYRAFRGELFDSPN